MPAPRLTVVQIGTLGDDGDGMYRLHQPAAALAALDGFEVYNVHCIAESPHDYVARAVTLGTDRSARARLTAAITAQSGLLFENAAPVHQLEDWFAQVTASTPR